MVKIVEVVRRTGVVDETTAGVVSELEALLAGVVAGLVSGTLVEEVTPTFLLVVLSVLLSEVVLEIKVDGLETEVVVATEDPGLVAEDVGLVAEVVDERTVVLEAELQSNPMLWIPMEQELLVADGAALLVLV